MPVAVAASVHNWSTAPVNPVLRHVGTYSSGLSFRALPNPSYAEIEKVCAHVRPTKAFITLDKYCLLPCWLAAHSPVAPDFIDV
eukprot:scaffold3821_cov134-Isochrysis_galbana.AAC.7